LMFIRVCIADLGCKVCIADLMFIRVCIADVHKGVYS
jgi:hypothetical protein